MSAKPYRDMQTDAYGEFSTSAVCLILNLTNRPHYVSQKRLKFVRWRY
jgi:mannitol operon repressor